MEILHIQLRGAAVHPHMQREHGIVLPGPGSHRRPQLLRRIVALLGRSFLGSFTTAQDRGRTRPRSDRGSRKVSRESSLRALSIADQISVSGYGSTAAPGLAALRWLGEGFGYEVSGVDVWAAYSHTINAAARVGRCDEVRERVHTMVTGHRFLVEVLRRDLGLTGKAAS
jgi:hypothetical protein